MRAMRGERRGDGARVVARERVLSSSMRGGGRWGASKWFGVGVAMNVGQEKMSERLDQDPALRWLGEPTEAGTGWKGECNYES